MDQALSNIYNINVAQQIKNWLSNEITIMSFDCATDNMGVVVMQVNIPIWIPDIKKILKYVKIEDYIKVISYVMNIYNNILDDMLKVIYCDRWKLSPIIKTKTSMTTEILTNLKNKIQLLLNQFGEPNYAIYEFQMGQNVKTGHIQDAIIYQFVCSNTKLIKMGASLKNLIIINNDLKVQNFYAKYNTSYKANKAHSEASFMYWCKLFNVDIERFLNSKKNKYEKMDDMADAWEQIMAAIKFNYLSSSLIK